MGVRPKSESVRAQKTQGLEHAVLPSAVNRATTMRPPAFRRIHRTTLCPLTPWRAARRVHASTNARSAHVLTEFCAKSGRAFFAL